MPFVSSLEHLRDGLVGDLEVDKKRPGLLLNRVLHNCVDFPHPWRVDVVVKLRVLGHDQNPDIRIQGMDRPNSPLEVYDRDLADLEVRELLPAEALEIRPVLLVVVEPGRQQGDVALARILRDPRHPQGQLRVVAPWAVLALDRVVQDLADPVLAVVPPLVREVPAAPADPAKACRFQEFEMLRVITHRNRCRIVPRACLRSHYRQPEAEPLQVEVQLVEPCHPNNIAGADGIDPDVVAGVQGRAPLAQGLLVREEVLIRRGRRRGVDSPCVRVYDVVGPVVLQVLGARADAA
mmetsp:Transcript_9738/g.27331  ORF Transcript_9738/g.27331 Transcript_9738/m.27331 type:complete len:293 (+) Transcript_9738:485-1363(+)